MKKLCIILAALCVIFGVLVGGCGFHLWRQMRALDETLAFDVHNIADDAREIEEAVKGGYTPPVEVGFWQRHVTLRAFAHLEDRQRLGFRNLDELSRLVLSYDQIYAYYEENDWPNERVNWLLASLNEYLPASRNSDLRETDRLIGQFHARMLDEEEDGRFAALVSIAQRVHAFAVGIDHIDPDPVEGELGWDLPGLPDIPAA